MSDFPTEASQNATPEALDRLLEHPAIWRGRSAAHIETVSSGFPSLDEALPGGGWPRAGLVEVLLPHAGIGELALFMPALAAHGVALGRVLVARAGKPLWALEQALGSGACAAALAWIERAHPRDVRRLQLATERGRTLGVLFREPHGGRGSTCAALRLRLAAAKDGVRITLVKSRGGLRGTVDLLWQQP